MGSSEFQIQVPRKERFCCKQLWPRVLHAQSQGLGGAHCVQLGGSPEKEDHVPAGHKSVKSRMARFPPLPGVQLHRTL